MKLATTTWDFSKYLNIYGSGPMSKALTVEANKFTLDAVIAIDVGSNHDVTEKQIVNSILKYARIKKEEIGAITIKPEESHIEFAPDVARHVMRTMQDATVNDFVVVLRAVTPKLGQSKGGSRGGNRSGQNRGGQNRGGNRGGQSRGGTRGRRGR